jgi:hypothetical protein
MGPGFILDPPSNLVFQCDGCHKNCFFGTTDPTSAGLSGSKAGAVHVLPWRVLALPAFGPSAEKQQNRSEEGTGACVGDDMAEWSVCETVGDVATVGHP